MAYDHSKKIGNQGDVAKHAILAAVVEHLLQKHGPFRYVEAHSGRAEYVLPKGGEWQQGINKLVKAAKDNGKVPEPLQPYWRFCFGDSSATGQKITVGQRWYGSSGMVFRLVLQKELEPEFQLFDQDAAVWADLVRYFHPWPRISVLNADGYQGVLGVSVANVVLLDPPDLNQPHRLLATMEHLKERNIPFICWTPRNGNTNGEEGKSYKDFRAAVKKDGVNPILFRWHDKWHSRFPGCCIHVYPGELGDFANTVACAVRKLLSWHKE